MRFIPTSAHGLADYLVGLVVIALPLYFAEWTGSPRVAFIALGLFVICYSLLTDYELGPIRFLRIRFHLLLDALVGIIMLIVPTLLRLPNDTRMPVYVIGVLSLFLAATTKVRAQGTGSETST
jgi:hypothetical protein